MSKRHSVIPAAPPTPVHIVPNPRCRHPVMADVVSIVGTFPVYVGGDSVIHPRCKLDAKTGSIKVGMRCIVEERAVVGGAATSLSPPGVVPEGTVKLGDYTSVETGALIDAGVTISTGCHIGQKCQIGTGAVIGKYCALSPRTIIQPGEKLPDYTVVYGGVRRRDGRDGSAVNRHKNQNYKLETLRKLIPNMSDKYVQANPQPAA